MVYLVLENGMTFEGQRIGAPLNRIGELVFTTGVVGYLETLTDPSYSELRQREIMIQYLHRMLLWRILSTDILEVADKLLLFAIY